MEAEGSGESAEHEAYQGDIDPALGAGLGAFVVADETAVAHEPAEDTFDDPAPGRCVGRPRSRAWGGVPGPPRRSPRPRNRHLPRCGETRQASPTRGPAGPSRLHIHHRFFRQALKVISLYSIARAGWLIFQGSRCAS